MISHRGFRFTSPVGKVGSVFLQFRVRGNIKFRFLVSGQNETGEIPPTDRLVDGWFREIFY